MAADHPATLFTNSLSMDGNEFSATNVPMATSFGSSEDCGRTGLDLVSWPAMDCYSQFNFAPDVVFDSCAYNSFPLPSPMTAPSNYLTPDTLDLDWTGTGSVSTGTTYSRPLSDSPITEFSYLGAETDADHGQQSFPLAEAIKPVQSDRKRSTASSDRPSKRRCSQAIGTESSAIASAAAAVPVEKGNPSKTPTKPKPDSTKPKARRSSVVKPRSTSSSTASSSTRSSGGGSGGTYKAQLRTASRKPKGPGGSPTAADDPDEEDLLTPEERRARHSHNLVEKQYRNRLNQQFESLLAVLPPADSGSRSFVASGGVSGGGGKTKQVGKGADDGGRAGRGSVAAAAVEADDRRLSKAEVLDMARQRIVALERECSRLQCERSELAANVGVVRDAVAKQRMVGGVVA